MQVDNQLSNILSDKNEDDTPVKKRRIGWTEDGEEIEFDSDEENVAWDKVEEQPKNLKAFEIILKELASENVRYLRLLNETSLPASYEDNFYKQLMQSINHWKANKSAMYNNELPTHWTKLAYVTNSLVGAICCQLEEENEQDRNTERHFENGVSQNESASNSKAVLQSSSRYRHVNILTLASLPSYRRRGVASLLLQNLIDWCRESSGIIKSIFLHVQTNNESALGLYKKFSFEIVKKIDNYYRRIEPTSAYLLQLKIIPGVREKLQECDI